MRGAQFVQYSGGGGRVWRCDDRAECDASSRFARSRHRYRGGQFAAIQSAAPSLRVEVRPINVRDAGEIERTVTAFARVPNGSLIVTRSGLAHVHHDLIINLAARHKLPAIYFERYFVAAGGLISTALISPTSTNGRLAMSIASSRARSRLTCRCRRRPSTSS